MYQRFTDRARKVMQMAKREAMRFNHVYIGTEHVLLGLIRSSGVASMVFKELNIDLKNARLEVEKIVASGPEDVAGEERPLTPSVQKIITFAIEEARKLGHNYVATEHLLLGLIRDEHSVATQVLFNAGVDLIQIREKTLFVLGRLNDGVPRVGKAVKALKELHKLLQQLKKSGVFDISAPDDEVPRVGKALMALEGLYEVLQQMKETAVARTDFEWAAALRDQTDKLKEMREFLRREGHRDPPHDPFV